MENFIYQLYSGLYYETIYNDQEFLEEHNKKLDKAIEIRNKIEEGLSKEQKDLLDKYQAAEADVWMDEEERLFARGVKIGLRLQKTLDEIKLI